MASNVELLTFEIPEEPGRAQVNLTLGRSTVFLGANGSGKSKLMVALAEMAERILPNRPAVYVEGGRALGISGSLVGHEIQSSAQIAEERQRKDRKYFSKRLLHTFRLLLVRSEEAKIRHSDQVSVWLKGPRVESIPDVTDDPLARTVDLFKVLFPDISIEVDTDQKKIKCIQAGSEYALSELSDGEKQTFCLIADIAVLAEPHSFIVIDEPDLNLNPDLACRLWDIIEAERPDAVFVYATHCLSFALRSGVDSVIALGKGRCPVIVQDLINFGSEELRPFLGAIPAVMSSERTIVVEGDSSSIDIAFYRWLIDDPTLQVVPLGGGNDVFAAASRQGVWRKVAPAVKLIGIIDRDYKPEEQLDRNATNVLTLNYHEVESYLCSPIVASSLAQALGTCKSLLSESDVENTLREHFEAAWLQVAARRIFARIHFRIGVSLSRADLQRITSETDLKNAVVSAVNEQIARASTAMSSNIVLQVVDEEVDRCKRARSGPVDELLRLCPGKEVLAKLHRPVGCKSPNDYVRGLAKHLKAEDFSPLRSLRNDVMRLLESGGIP